MKLELTREMLRLVIMLDEICEELVYLIEKEIKFEKSFEDDDDWLES